MHRSPPAQAAAEPDMRHPKIQRLIGSNARKAIEMSLVEDLIEDPNGDQSSMAMEYWNSTHDRLREALLKQAAPVAPAEKVCKLTECHGLPRCGTCRAMDAAPPAPSQLVIEPAPEHEQTAINALLLSIEGLPPLPEARKPDENGAGWFTAGQMHAYALAAAGFARRPSLWAMQAHEVLGLIAVPQRPDGTWNRDREACRQLAAKALGRRYDDAPPAPAQAPVEDDKP